MKKDSLLKSTGLFGIATLMSRILGLVRDSCIAAFVPHVWQDIFWAGFKIPSTCRQLFAEGALSAAFIPLLTRVREREGEDAVRIASAAIFRALAITVGAVSVLAILLAPWFVPILLQFPQELNLPNELQPLAQEMQVMPSENWRVEAGIWATQMMFPFLFFIALSAWAMGVLNTYRIFFIPALAPTLFNASLIVGCFVGAWFYGAVGFSLMSIMIAAVIIGGLLQFVIQIFPARKIKYFPPPWASPFHPKVGMFLKILAPSVFGLAIYQINSLITQTCFASQYGSGGISQMNYAFRLIQFPLGVIGVALATASFPRIAQFFEQGKHEEASKTLINVIKYLTLLMIPSAVGLIVLAPEIVGVIYDRGNFHASGWLQPTVEVLVMYCIGLFFFAIVKVLVRTFQARHDFRTPVITGIISVAFNIALCAWFVHTGWPLWSLALASSLASGLQMVLLGVLLWPSMKNTPLWRLIPFFIRVIIAAAGMALACRGLMELVPVFTQSQFELMARVVLGVGAGVTVFFGLGWLLFRPELQAVLKRK